MKLRYREEVWINREERRLYNLLDFDGFVDFKSGGEGWFEEEVMGVRIVIV